MIDSKTNSSPTDGLRFIRKGATLALHDLISISHLTPKEIRQIFQTTKALKAKPRDFSTALAGKSVIL